MAEAKPKAEGYAEDVVPMPSDGLDDARYANAGSSFEIPSGKLMDNKYDGVENPVIPYEPGENPATPTWGENDFPRQTGHDSLPDDVVPLT